MRDALVVELVPHREVVGRTEHAGEREYPVFADHLVDVLRRTIRLVRVVLDIELELLAVDTVEFGVGVVEVRLQRRAQQTNPANVPDSGNALADEDLVVGESLAWGCSPFHTC